MTPSLSRPLGNLTPAEALSLAQQAPIILKNNPEAISTSPLPFLFTAPETAELWNIYENLLMSCLRVGDDEAAYQCVERLVLRFGDSNPRIMAFKGLVMEAEAKNFGELEGVLRNYEEALKEDGSNIPITKRKIALLRSMGKIPESIAAMNALLDFSPTDAEAWAELADMYVSQGLYPQAIFALEDVLVQMPNAWNMHARLGEVLLMASKSSGESVPEKYLAESLKRFCRSIELCDDYLRGFYGLKLVTDSLLSSAAKSKKTAEADGFALPEVAVIEKLNQAATSKLSEIVRRYTAQEPSWQGYDVKEITAARELLAKSSPQVVR